MVQCQICGCADCPLRKLGGCGGQTIDGVVLAPCPARTGMVRVLRARGDRLLRRDFPPKPKHGQWCGTIGAERYCRECKRVSDWYRSWQAASGPLIDCLNLESRLHGETLKAIAWATCRGSSRSRRQWGESNPIEGSG